MLRLREVKWLAQGHSTSEWKMPSFTLGFYTPNPVLSDYITVFSLLPNACTFPLWRPPGRLLMPHGFIYFRHFWPPIPKKVTEACIMMSKKWFLLFIRSPSRFKMSLFFLNAFWFHLFQHMASESKAAARTGGSSKKIWVSHKKAMET